MGDVGERRSLITTLDVVLAVFYALAIFVVGSLHNTPAVVQDVSDKVQHCVGFALLAWLWCRALRRFIPGARPLGLAFGGFAISVALGGALELWQGVLGYRSCDFLDWVADAIGAALGVGIPTALELWLGSRARARAAK